MTGQQRLKAQLTEALLRHLESKERATVPEAGVWHWNAFMELSAARTWYQGGPQPIASSEIEAWARLNSWPLQRHHVDILRAMDSAMMQHFQEVARAAEAKAGGKPQPGKRPRAPISAAMFDARFG